MKSLQVSSKNQFELIDITDKINEQIEIASGLALLFVPHTTAGIVCNENESKLKNDILDLLKEFKASRQFKHDPGEGNAHAHVINALTQGARIFIIENGRLALGTWQKVLFLEMDGPRDRQIWVKTLRD